jgi:hypothetical protein
MTSITQKIPRYILGMSDQPDELKVPGQVRDAKNVLPDVTLGLLKRPGTKYLGNLTTNSEGTWFTIYKNNRITNDERYICQITYEGYVNIWSMKSGKPMNIRYSADPIDPAGQKVAGFYDASSLRIATGPEDYFIQDRANQLHTMSVNDYTFVTNKQVSVSMSSNVADKRSYEAFVHIKALAYNQPYILDLDKPGENVPDQPPVTFTRASRVSVSPSGWSLSTYCVGSPGCLRAGQWTETLSSGTDKTGLNVTVTSSCTAVPDGCSNNSVSESYSLSATLNNGGSGWAVGDQVYVELGGNPFIIRVDEVTTETTTSADEGRAEYVEPDTGATLSASTILDNLKSDIEGFNKGYTVEKIGNGLYITNDYPFVITTPDPTLMDVMSGTDQQQIGETEENFITQVNNIGRLPNQCKHGYVVKIVNTGAEEDDYYVQFYGNNDLDGEGVWEECAKPGIPHTINAFTMPHVLIRTANVTTDADGDLISEFYVGPLQWAPRAAGDEITNPRPSFCPPPGANFGNAINATVFFRDRLTFLSEENIVMSRTSEHFELFGQSAVTIAANDPIDVSSSSTVPAVLHDGIVIPAGLLVVSPNQQFLLRTENDLLSPLTVKVTNVSSYSVNQNTKPLSLGTTVGFFSNAGKYSRFYEMFNITNSTDPEVVEQSKAAGTLLPANLEIIADSQENDLILATEPGSNEVYCFKYFNTGEKRALNSWFRWTMFGEVLTHTVIRDSYYAALLLQGNVYLVRADLRPLYGATTITEEDYRIHMDYYKGVEADDLVYNFDKNSTSFIRTVPNITGETLTAFSLGDEPGRIGSVTVNGSLCTIKGDWTDSDIVIGYPFDMQIDFPNLYVTSRDGLSGSVKSDTRGSLIVQRMMLDLGDSGTYTATLKCLGRDDREIVFESAFQDYYKANSAAIIPSVIRNIPVYDRNTNFRLELNSKHPAPTTIYSMEWEGDYTNMYYKSV